MSNRVFTDDVSIACKDDIRRSAEKHWPGAEVVWLRVEQRSCAGRTYMLRRLGVAMDGVVLATAHPNRRGAVYWSTLYLNDYMIESEAHNETA